MKNSKATEFLRRMLQGMLIGTGAILPGVSGGVLCVAFGIYEPMMQLLADPLRSLKKQLSLFVPLILGGGIGFVLLAGVIERFLAASEAAALMLFVGLICGTVPGLMANAVKHEPKNGWGIFACVLFGSYIFFRMLEGGAAAAISPNFGWYLFCGVIWGLSMVVPGLSSSSLLLFLGLYAPMSAGIAALDFAVLIPLGLGFAVTVLAAGRVVNALLQRCPVAMTRSILGFVISSTVMITPTEFASGLHLLLGICCFAAGFALALLMDSARPNEE